MVNLYYSTGKFGQEIFFFKSIPNLIANVVVFVDIDPVAACCHTGVCLAVLPDVISGDMHVGVLAGERDGNLVEEAHGEVNYGNLVDDIGAVDVPVHVAVHDNALKALYEGVHWKIQQALGSSRQFLLLMLPMTFYHPQDWFLEEFQVYVNLQE